MKKNIITIGRQYGSGGHVIGAALAEKLGLAFYDRELILLAADQSGMSREVLERVDETATNSFLYAISTGAYFMGNLYPVTNTELPMSDKLYLEQAKVIRAAAEKGGCVIVGRCADAVLQEDFHDRLLSVFVHADEEFRRRNVVQRQQVSDKKAMELMNKADRRRSSYYSYYSQKRWGAAESYDLMLNHASLSTDTAVAVIAAALS